MIRKITLMIAAFIMLTPMSVLAAGAGDAIPHDLALKNQNGEVQSFEQIAGEKGVVLVFVRSADWCPFCQVQLLDLRDKGQEIEALGYNIVPISYDAPDVLKRFTSKYDYPYTMLSDQGSAAIKAFGILNEEFNPDHFAYGVPHPYVFIIGRNKVIQGRLSEEGYKDRPQVSAIVEKIKGQN